MQIKDCFSEEGEILWVFNVVTKEYLKKKISEEIMPGTNWFLNSVQLHDRSKNMENAHFFSLFFFSLQIFIQQIVHLTHTLIVELQYMCFIAQISLVFAENVSSNSKLLIRSLQLLNVFNLLY